MPSSAPCCAREGDLLRRRGAGDHARAHQLAEFDGRKADAAGGAQHGQRLAGFELGAVLERMQRGAIGDAEAGGVVEIEAVGNVDQLVGRDRDAFARGAVSPICR